MRGALESRKGARHIFRPLFRESGVGGRFRARCAQYRARFGQTRARAHAVRATRLVSRPGGGAGVRFSPSRTTRQTLPGCCKSAPRTQKDHRLRLRCRHPPWPRPFFVFFLVLSSPEPLFFSDFSVLDARPVPEGFVAGLALFFLCGFVPAFVSEVALVLAFSFAFGFEVVRDSTRRGSYHVPPFKGRPMRSPRTAAFAAIHPHASG